MNASPIFSDLTIHHIRFTAEATTPIEMDAFKGSAIRGAWQSYLSRAYCGAPPAIKATPEHQAACPVCYLTNRDTGSESRRPFALRPPQERQTRYEPGERFQFTFSLFGQNALFLLPYVALALHEVGESWGLGRYQRQLDGRGRYRLVRMDAYDPHSGQEQVIMPEGTHMVNFPTLSITAESIAQRAQRLTERIRRQDNLLRLRILTPLRLIHQNGLMRRFAFPPFLQRLTERLFALGQHYGQQPQQYDRDALRATIARLLPQARKVQIRQNDLVWWDVKGYSSRLKKYHYLGGLVGEIALYAEDWRPMLPLLLWGESVQLGKNVVKGGGWYEIED